MQQVQFILTPSKIYRIADCNDEELYVIGQLLLDEETRRGAKELIEKKSEWTWPWGIKNYHDMKTTRKAFDFTKTPFNIIEIRHSTKTTAQENESKLIEISTMMLGKIISEWEMYERQKPSKLLLYQNTESDEIHLTDQIPD
jgi:hypothetical protein